MIFWEGNGLVQLLMIGALLAIAAGIRRLFPPLRWLTMPDSMTAGLIGFILGPSLLALLPWDPEFLKVVVYHALAIVFITVGLKTPIKARNTSGAKSLAVAIPLLAIWQGLLGLVLVLGWNQFVEPLHPGYGLMLPLAFSQGPGQALSLGSAWEQAPFHMVDGGMVGLIMAAIGFGWCVFFGVPMVLLGRRLGWSTPLAEQGEAAKLPTIPKTAPPGGMDTLSLNLVNAGGVYLATFGVIYFVTSLLESKPGLAAMIWGFHFIISGILAMLFRRVLQALPIQHRLHDGLLSRIASTTVDVATVAAISAIQLSVLRDYLGPILLLTTSAGLTTGLIAFWLARRAFPKAPFEHAVVLFGLSTGNLTTGLALLRILDPDLRGPVAASTVMGATAAIIFGAPLLLVVIPTAVSGFPDTYPNTTYIALGMMVVYSALLILGWRYIGPLRWRRPWLHIWPVSPED